ncbi:MAG: YeeE/YedE thiosulfate transporter family protein [Rhizobiaceae bacterium]
MLTSGCISCMLVLTGSGNGRSWVTLFVAAVSAYATLQIKN